MQQLLDFPVAPRYSFDNFVTCLGNAAALRFARQFAAQDDLETVLYLHGPHGSGKTHLISSIAAAASSASPLPVISLSEWVGRPDLSCFVASCSSAPILLLDDIHLLRSGTPLHDAVWHLCNEFHSNSRRIAASGLFAPGELDVDEHLRSRLLWGLVAGLDVMDDESRTMIIRKLASDRQIIVPDDAVKYIVSRADRGIGALVQLFERIYRYSLALKRPVTSLLVREACMTDSCRME